MSGGAGNNKHLISGLSMEKVDAVCTSHLFNFVGDGLKLARISALENNIPIPSWGNKITNWKKLILRFNSF